MQIQRTDEVSFQRVILSKSGKKALNALKRTVFKEDSATEEFARTLTDFKRQLDDFDAKTNTKGIDIVVTTETSDATGWQTLPALIFKKGRKQLLDALYLDELTPPEIGLLGASDLLIRSNNLGQKIENWFGKNYPKLLDITKPSIKKAHSRNDIISDVFGRC